MKVGVTGHQDVPVEATAYVRDAMAAILSPMSRGLVGITSLAAGADQIFAGVVRSLGGRLHVVVPSTGYEAAFKDPADLERYRAFLSEAQTVERMEHPKPSAQAYLAAGRRVVERSDMLLAVWDGHPAKGKGGTAEIVDYAAEGKVPVTVVWPQGVVR